MKKTMLLGHMLTVRQVNFTSARRHTGHLGSDVAHDPLTCEASANPILKIGICQLKLAHGRLFSRFDQTLSQRETLLYVYVNVNFDPAAVVPCPGGNTKFRLEPLKSKDLQFTFTPS
jgi:hypothetical protein